jgi:hypothetical protein
MTQQKSTKSVKAKPSSRAQRSRKAETPAQRPIELMVWAVLLGLFGAYSLLQALQHLNAGWGAIIGALTGGFVVAFAVGLWFWQRWAYFGIIIAFSIVILIAVAGGLERNFGSLLLSMVILFVTVALVQPRLAQFR